MNSNESANKTIEWKRPWGRFNEEKAKQLEQQCRDVFDVANVDDKQNYKIEDKVLEYENAVKEMRDQVDQTTFLELAAECAFIAFYTSYGTVGNSTAQNRCPFSISHYGCRTRTSTDNNVVGNIYTGDLGGAIEEVEVMMDHNSIVPTVNIPKKINGNPFFPNDSELKEAKLDTLEKPGVKTTMTLIYAFVNPDDRPTSYHVYLVLLKSRLEEVISKAAKAPATVNLSEGDGGSAQAETARRAAATIDRSSPAQAEGLEPVDSFYVDGEPDFRVLTDKQKEYVRSVDSLTHKFFTGRECTEADMPLDGDDMLPDTPSVVLCNTCLASFIRRGHSSENCTTNLAALRNVVKNPEEHVLMRLVARRLEYAQMHIAMIFQRESGACNSADEVRALLGVSQEELAIEDGAAVDTVLQTLRGNDAWYPSLQSIQEAKLSTDSDLEAPQQLEQRVLGNLSVFLQAAQARFTDADPINPNRQRNSFFVAHQGIPAYENCDNFLGIVGAIGHSEELGYTQQQYADMLADLRNIQEAEDTPPTIVLATYPLQHYCRERVVSLQEEDLTVEQAAGLLRLDAEEIFRYRPQNAKNVLAREELMRFPGAFFEQKVGQPYEDFIQEYVSALERQQTARPNKPADSIPRKRGTFFTKRDKAVVLQSVKPSDSSGGGFFDGSKDRKPVNKPESAEQRPQTVSFADIAERWGIDQSRIANILQPKLPAEAFIVEGFHTGTPSAVLVSALEAFETEHNDRFNEEGEYIGKPKDPTKKEEDFWSKDSIPDAFPEDKKFTSVADVPFQDGYTFENVAETEASFLQYVNSYLEIRFTGLVDEHRGEESGLTVALQISGEGLSQFVDIDALDQRAQEAFEWYADRSYKRIAEEQLPDAAALAARRFGLTLPVSSPPNVEENE